MPPPQKANDFRTTQFLDWFIKEQGEEEKNSSDQITKMRLYGDDARSLYMLNSELLSRTYVVRTLYRPGRGRVSNPDYTFLSIHYESVREYLSLLDWDLRRDDINGYFYVLNTDEANRCILSKRETAILLALRMLLRRKSGAPGTRAGRALHRARGARKGRNRLRYPAGQAEYGGGQAGADRV